MRSLVLYPAELPARALLRKENGAPEEIRTPDPQIRSLVLYPAELRVRIGRFGTTVAAGLMASGERDVP